MQEEKQMRIVNHWVSRSLAIATFVAGLVVSASAQQAGLVNVNIEDVIDDIAIDINVEENQILDNVGVVVQAPIGVAANVCNVAANVLAQAAQEGDANCDAQTNSTALNSIVQRALLD